MVLKLIFLEEFGKAFVPRRLRPYLRAFFLKAGITEVSYKLFGAIFYISIIATFTLYFYKIYPLFSEDASLIKIFAYTGVTWIALPLLFTTALGAALYFYLDYKIYDRTKKMEDVLSDFLRLVSENLKGGMNFEKALWTSIRPEFGILASEVRLAAKKVMTGQDVEDALNEFTMKYDSPILKRAFNLMVEGMKGGGEIAEIIDRVIEDIEEMKELKAEMRATNLSYIIFITFVVIIVAPGLFTLSFQFLSVLTNLSSKLGVSAQSTVTPLPISFGKVGIDLNTFMLFSQYALVIISGFAAIIVAIINHGNIKGGLKLIPIYIISSIVMYRILMIIVASIFGNLFL